MFRPRGAAADPLPLATRVMALLAATMLAAWALLPAPAHAQSGGRTGASLPYAKALNESLTYDTFTNTSCSQAGFSTAAVAHLDIAGHIFVDGQTTLNGVPYDSYADDLQFGPDTFATTFFRPRVGDPAFGATSSSYTFTFRSRVRRDQEFIGTSVTTFVCASGVPVSVTNEWVPAVPPIPAGHPLAWAALALILAASAARKLALRRA
jgi:hypothetical protein